MLRPLWWFAAYSAAMLVMLSLLYWQPRIDAPRPVDAVVVLGVPKERLATGIELVEAGYSGVLVVSSPDPETQPLRVPVTCQNDAGKAAVPSGVEVICFTPAPFSTEGEAAAVEALAAEHGWDEVLVVTYRSHLNRARWYFDRCAPSVTSYFVANEAEHSVLRYVNRMIYETGAWFKVATQWEC